MINISTEKSLQNSVRLGGIAYLVIIVAGIFGEMFVRNAIVVSGDAVATANNIISSPKLWRLGIAGDLIMHMCDVILMVVFYMIFSKVSKPLALLALLFNLIQTAVLVTNKLNLMLPLFLLQDSDYLKVFDPNQLKALAYVSIRTHGHGFGFGLIFFGLTCLVLGFLIIKSEIFPKAIGIMMQIGGVCYLINSFALIISPSFANKLFPFILLPPFIAELSLCLWMIVKGVNVSRWNEYTVVQKVNN